MTCGLFWRPKRIMSEFQEDCLVSCDLKALYGIRIRYFVLRAQNWKLNQKDTERQFSCQFRLLPHTQLSHIQINIQEVSLSSCYQKNYPGGQLDHFDCNYIAWFAKSVKLHNMQQVCQQATTEHNEYEKLFLLLSCSICRVRSPSYLVVRSISLSTWIHLCQSRLYQYLYLTTMLPDFICELFLSSSFKRFRCMNSGPLVEELFQWSLPNYCQLLFNIKTLLESFALVKHSNLSQDFKYKTLYI